MSSSSSNSSSHIGDVNRGIWLQRDVQSRFQTNVIDGFRWKVTALGGNNMPNAIFRFLRRPLSSGSGVTVDEFDGVCSPSDLEEFDEGAPIADREPKFLRLDTVDLVFRSQHEADETWTAVVEDVTSLVNTLKVMEITVPAETLAIGSPNPL